jgi:hypothetical protein
MREHPEGSLDRLRPPVRYVSFLITLSAIAELRRDHQVATGFEDLLDDDQTALPICPPARQEHPEQSLTRAETWPPCACSLQDRKLMAQDDEFQQQIKALAEPRPHCRKPSKDPSRHEL